MSKLLKDKYFVDFFSPDWFNNELSTGTTILACEFADGVIFGADSRTSTGVYVANRVTDKLTRITDKIYCCRSGSAADTQAVADIVAYHLAFHEIELNEAPLVEIGAGVFREMCYNYRDTLLAGILVAGWDRKKGGQVYCIPVGGMCTRLPIGIGGSGSTYIYGYVDANYRQGMQKDECVNFAINTIALAMQRDGSSGGCVRIGIITEKGMERKLLLGTDLPKFFET